MANRTWEGRDGSTPNDWSVAGNWTENAVPVSTDTVVIPAGSAAITAGLNQSAVTLAGFFIDAGFDQDIGSSDAYLEVAVSANVRVSCAGGQQFIDLGASNYSVEVLATGAEPTGQKAFNILGSNLATLSVLGGSVGCALIRGETSTIATLRTLGGSTLIGTGVTLTTASVNSGTASIYCAATTVNVFGGTAETFGTGAVTTINMHEGQLFPGSSGTITTLNGYGGRVDFGRSAISRTVTTLTPHARDPLTIILDPTVITVTNYGEPAEPYQVQYA